ncbi:hypothetical protein ABLE68_07910 [Nocardioides sp. CN2-186]|uniref:hypothetical protein n=1 Tax=Nocardioides tweenelious TaxID=3156607 RepID=UPI0032B55DD5
MTRTPRRRDRIASRLGVLAGSSSLLVAAVLVAPPAAEAAWGSGARVHGGEVQACKVRNDDGSLTIRTRLDNRRASHTHLGGMSRTRDGHRVSVNVRAAAGKISGTKSLRWRSGDVLSIGIGETTGEGLGGSIDPSQIPHC